MGIDLKSLLTLCRGATRYKKSDLILLKFFPTPRTISTSFCFSSKSNGPQTFPDFWCNSTFFPCLWKIVTDVVDCVSASWGLTDNSAVLSPRASLDPQIPPECVCVLVSVRAHLYSVKSNIYCTCILWLHLHVYTQVSICPQGYRSSLFLKVWGVGGYSMQKKIKSDFFFFFFFYKLCSSIVAHLAHLKSVSQPFRGSLFWVSCFLYPKQTQNGENTDFIP